MSTQQVKQVLWSQWSKQPLGRTLGDALVWGSSVMISIIDLFNYVYLRGRCTHTSTDVFTRMGPVRGSLLPSCSHTLIE